MNSKSKYPTDVNFACIDGVNYAVPLSVRFILECRGFLFSTDTDPRVTNPDSTGVDISFADSWSPEKKLLHVADPTQQQIKPLRLKTNKEKGMSRLFMCTGAAKDKSLNLVCCKVF